MRASLDAGATGAPPGLDGRPTLGFGPAPGRPASTTLKTLQDGTQVNQSLVLTPLGGLGEIGMNCLALEQTSDGVRERLLVDCGVTFPNDDHGVELYHPRFDAILDEGTILRGLILTHGHEDHVGAIPYLVAALTEQGAPRLLVAGPPYALEMARGRLADVGIDESRYELRAIRPGERLWLGGFGVEPVRVTHSIVDATALILETAAGTVVHSGDFKLESDPLDGQPTDEARLARAGDEGVRLLLSDSTNVFQAGDAGGELAVSEALEQLVATAEGRVVVGLFASNVHRLGALGAIARRTGRHVCLLGRSVRRHAEVGRQLGWLAWPSDLVVAPEIAASLPPRRLLYLVTGTQGEPRAALARLAAEDHPDLRLGPGDRVVLSSRVIPGAEQRVFAMQDDLLRLGVDLVTRLTHPAIHVSGHAHRDEQRRLLELVRPGSFMPVHGTLLHLRRHAELAREVGIEDTLVLQNGERAELGSSGLAKRGKFESGRVAIAAGRPVTAAVLQERRELGRSGLIVVVVGPGSGALRVVTRGVNEAERVRTVAEGAVRGVLATGATRDLPRLVEALWRAVRARVLDATGQRPVVEVDVVDAGRKR
ncbi:MAG: ribonuclease J [Deltaproteobacteria bacterium]|nr:ribonuclease J [Deltaproteobacteria bacterium]